MHAAACLVAWFGSGAGWRMLALAMGEVPAAPCPGMEVEEEQRADDGATWSPMLRALLAAHEFGASAAAATATARASGATGRPTPRRGASEIAEAALAAAGPARDGPLHPREVIGGGELFRGAAVRIFGLYGAAGARALRGMTWAIGVAGLLVVAPQPSGDEGKEEQGAPDIFCGLSPLGRQVAAQLALPGGGGGGNPSVAAAIGVATAALRTAASGRGPLRAALESESVRHLQRLRCAVRHLEQRLGRSPRVCDLCICWPRVWWPAAPVARGTGARVGLPFDCLRVAA